METQLKVRRVIPEEWLIPARPVRVVLHWTAGAYRVSELDRSHYHVILQDDAALKQGEDVRPVRGRFSIADNDRTGDGRYAAHTRGLNGHSVGLSIACMAGAVQGGAHGRYPMTRRLWERLAQGAAEVCRHYGIPVTPHTVLQHGEVQRQLGVAQRGKWDCCELSFDRSLSPVEVCEQFRRKVAWYLERLDGETGVAR
jgi:hypothetical protein